MDPRALRLGIPARSEVVSVFVNSTSSSVKKYCRMMLDVSGKAKIYGAWTNVVKDFNLTEGEIYMFSFTDQRLLPYRLRDQFAWLKLELLKLEE